MRRVRLSRFLYLAAALILLLSLNFHALAQSEALFYFSELTPTDGQLRLIDCSGQIRNVFANHNEGTGVTASPDGNFLAFVRWDWAATSEVPITLWVANLRSQAQWPVAMAPAGGGIEGTWAPDSQHLLVHQNSKVGPLWAGNNYGQLAIYDVPTRTTTALTIPYVFAIGWYPDSKRILLWNENRGYLIYDVATKSTIGLTLQGLAKSAAHLGQMSSQSAAWANLLDGEIFIFDADTGYLQRPILANELSSRYVIDIAWSPDGNCLALYFSQDHYVAIWQRSTSQITLLPSVNSGNAFPRVFGWSRDSTFLFVVNDTDPTNLAQLDVTKGRTTHYRLRNPVG